VAGRKQKVSANDVVVVPAGTQHQFYNTGKTPLELVTVYSPAEHQADTVHKTKEEGDELEDAGYVPNNITYRINSVLTSTQQGRGT